MEVYVTLDPVFRDYVSAFAKRELWLRVQPFIAVTDLSTFLRDALDGSEQTFHWWDNSRWHDNGASGAPPLIPPDQLVPVPFTAAQNVKLDLMAGDTSLLSLLNDRSALATICDDAAFEAKNRPRTDTTNAPPDQVYSSRQRIGAGAFAARYATGLSAMANTAGADLENIRHYLELGLTLGTTRYLPVGSVINLLPEAIMGLNGSTSGMITSTNLHSLCGLMFRLAVRDSDRALSSCTDIILTIRQAGVQDRLLKLQRDGSPKLYESMVHLFSGLATYQSSEVPAPLMVWDETYERRAYVKDVLVTYYPVSINGATYYRRRSTDSVADSKYLHLGNAQRAIAVPLKAQAPVVGTNYPSPLSWSCYYAYDGVLTPYQGSAPLAGPDGALMMLRPRPGFEVPFYNEFRTDPVAGQPNEFAFPSALVPLAGLKTVGIFEYPWDRSVGNGQLTILYCGPSSACGPVSVIFRRGVAAFQSALVDDPLNLRWAEDLNFTGANDIVFNLVSCDTALSLDIALGVGFAGDVAFSLAQSASHTEAHLTVTYNAVAKTTSIDQVGVQDEIEHDIMDYNALNVFASDQSQELTFAAEAYPLAVSGDPGTMPPTPTVAEYVYRSRLPAEVPPSDELPQLFYRDRFPKFGNTAKGGRILSFELEDLYGLTIPDQPVALSNALDMVIDFPIMNPALVRLSPDTMRPTTNSADSAFLTICYAYDTTKGESATLVFKTGWLNAANYRSEAMHDAHIAAWRSVLELANASDVVLEIDAWRFDFRLGANASEDTSDAALAQCLTSLDPPPSSISILKDVSEACQSLLYQNSFEPEIRIKVQLQPTMSPPLGDRAAVLMFHLTITRRDDLIPAAWLEGAGPPYTFVQWQGLAQDTGATGKAFGDGFGPPHGDVSAAYRQWRATLKSSTGAVIPERFGKPELDGASDFLCQAFGSATSNDPASVRARAWIFPELYGAAPPAASGWQGVVCPIAFMTVPNDHKLGDQTLSVLGRYARAIELVQSGQTREAGTKTAQQWTAYFQAMLMVYGDDGDGTLMNIHRRMLALLKPTPGVEARPEVLALAGQLNDATSIAAKSTQRWIDRALWLSPSLFGTTKSMLLTMLRGVNSPVPDVLGEIGTARTTRDGSVEQHTLSYRETVALDSGTQSIGIVEVLDMQRYGDAFTLAPVVNAPTGAPKGAVAQPYQMLLTELYRALEHDPAAPPPLTPTQMVSTGPLLLPDATSETVKLAARAAIVPPVHWYTGLITPLQQSGGMDPFKRKSDGTITAINGSLLARGEVTAATDLKDAMLLVSYYEAARPVTPMAEDQCWISSVFQIEGDEQYANPATWTSSFGDDEFRIDLVTPSFAVANLLEPPTGFAKDDPVEEFVSVLKRTADPKGIANLEIAICNPEIIKRLAAMLVPIGATPLPPKTLVAFRLDAPGPKAYGPTIAPVSNGIPYVAYLFCDSVNPTARVYLVVGVLSTLWQARGLTLYQTRNQDKIFDPAFFQSSTGSTERHVGRLRKRSDRRSEAGVPSEPITLARKPIALNALLAKLIPEGFSDPAGPSEFDLSVTVHFAPQRAYLQDYPVGTPTGLFASRNEWTKFPLVPIPFYIGGLDRDQPYDFFGTGNTSIHNDFAIDFEWFDELGAFLRIENCQVRVTDA